MEREASSVCLRRLAGAAPCATKAGEGSCVARLLRCRPPVAGLAQ